MRIAVLSDQHGELPPIPECDLMILSGDLTNGNAHGPRDGTDDRWWDWLHKDFAAWILGAPWTVATGGNHDTSIARFGSPTLPHFDFLMDSGCERVGLKFWGGPWIRRFDDLAFGQSDEEMEQHWDKVPKDTDVIVCHMPPLGHGDMLPGTGRAPLQHHVGCKWIAHTIQRVRPKLLTCGHIHEGRGIYDFEGTRVVNSARAFTVIDL